MDCSSEDTQGSNSANWMYRDPRTLSPLSSPPRTTLHRALWTVKASCLRHRTMMNMYKVGAWLWRLVI
ncbi:unnamed protein product [Gadus morhua 'NCC']